MISEDGREETLSPETVDRRRVRCIAEGCKIYFGLKKDGIFNRIYAGTMQSIDAQRYCYSQILFCLEFDEKVVSAERPRKDRTIGMR